MTKFNIQTLLFVCMIGLIQCTSKPSVNISELTWLNGTWISPDSINLETWAFENDGFNGNVYSAKEGKITERLRVFKEKEDVYYEATVLNQNDAKPISFKLNSNTQDSLHFSNLEHDFPTDIIYKKVSDTSIYVKVYSKSNAGFEFVMNKLKE